MNRLSHVLCLLLLFVGIGLSLADENSDYRIVSDIAYKDTGNVAHLLDIYLPLDTLDFPTIIYVTGGIGNNDGKGDGADLGRYFASQGFAGVIPNRSSNADEDLDTNADETANAIAWTLDNIELYGGDPSQVVIMTLSSGARHAALSILNPVYLEAYDYDMTNVAGMIFMGGLLETEANHAVLNLIPDRRSETVSYFSPINYIASDMPPTLFINGTDEVESILDFTQEFSDRANEIGSSSDWVMVEGNHAGIRARIGTDNDETTAVIADWLASIGIDNFITES